MTSRAGEFAKAGSPFAFRMKLASSSTRLRRSNLSRPQPASTTLFAVATLSTLVFDSGLVDRGGQVGGGDVVLDFPSGGHPNNPAVLLYLLLNSFLCTTNRVALRIAIAVDDYHDLPVEQSQLNQIV